MDLAALAAGLDAAGGPAVVAMKALTLAGVGLGALGLASARLGPAAKARCLAVAAAGVALMYANALIVGSPLAPLVSMGYVGLAAAVVRDGLARRAGGPAVHVAEAPGP